MTNEKTALEQIIKQASESIVPAPVGSRSYDGCELKVGLNFTDVPDTVIDWTVPKFLKIRVGKTPYVTSLSQIANYQQAPSDWMSGVLTLKILVGGLSYGPREFTDDCIDDATTFISQYLINNYGSFEVTSVEDISYL